MINIFKLLLVSSIAVTWCPSAVADSYQPCWPGGQINSTGECIYTTDTYPAHPAAHLAPSHELATAEANTGQNNDPLSLQADELIKQAKGMLTQNSVDPNPSSYGAVAWNFTTGQYITSIGESSKQQAEQIALNHCGPGCEIYASYSNTCLSMAEGAHPDNETQSIISGATDPGPTTAEKVALAECDKAAKKCKTIFTECSYRTRVLRYNNMQK